MTPKNKREAREVAVETVQAFYDSLRPVLNGLARDMDRLAARVDALERRTWPARWRALVAMVRRLVRRG